MEPFLQCARYIEIYRVRPARPRAVPIRILLDGPFREMERCECLEIRMKGAAADIGHRIVGRFDQAIVQTTFDPCRVAEIGKILLINRRKFADPITFWVSYVKI